MLAIVTPTFNRAHLLPRLYTSLENQSDFSFKWYVIDDGSTDNTAKVCKTFQPVNFELLYKYKENGGKHTALNYAYNFISEELTIIVDSDDWLSHDAVSTIMEEWPKYSNREDIAGMSFHKLNTNSEIVGDRFICEHNISDHIKYIINKQVRGDKAEVFRTSVLSSYPFPIFFDENYLSEAIVWIKIAENYKMVYIQKGIYYCEYLPDGLTSAGRGKLINNPRGYVEHAKAYLSTGIKQWIQWKYILMYIAASRFSNIPTKMAYQYCPRKIKFIFSFLLGHALYIYWKIKYK